MTYILYSRIGCHIRFRRQMVGISQDELAVRIGVDRTYLADIENGKRNINLTIYIRICRVLKSNIVYLINPTNTKNFKINNRNNKSLGLLAAFLPNLHEIIMDLQNLITNLQG